MNDGSSRKRAVTGSTQTCHTKNTIINYTYTTSWRWRSEGI